MILRYLTALNKEIELASSKYRKACIDTVYIGGGTPSALDGELVASLCDTLKKCFDLSSVKEWSIECNPESITDDKLAIYKSCGINRLSVGVQSLDDRNLKAVGRIHDSKIAIEKLCLASDYFDNLSCDLIIGLPFDDDNSIKNEVATLAPLVKHLSMYELIVEDGTPLKDMVESGQIKLPSDDEVQTLFEIAMEEASKFGFERYEVSNFARKGYMSLHNYGYWTREEYLGFGADAHSLVKTEDGGQSLKPQKRFADVKDVLQYTKNIENADNFDDIERVDVELLDEKDVKNERIMLGLRTTKGVESDILNVPHNLKTFFKNDGSYTHLTRKGLAVMNGILAQVLDI